MAFYAVDGPVPEVAEASAQRTAFEQSKKEAPYVQPPANPDVAETWKASSATLGPFVWSELGGGYDKRHGHFTWFKVCRAFRAYTSERRTSRVKFRGSRVAPPPSDLAKCGVRAHRRVDTSLRFWLVGIGCGDTTGFRLMLYAFTSPRGQGYFLAWGHPTDKACELHVISDYTDGSEAIAKMEAIRINLYQPPDRRTRGQKRRRRKKRGYKRLRR